MVLLFQNISIDIAVSISLKQQYKISTACFLKGAVKCTVNLCNADCKGCHEKCCNKGEKDNGCRLTLVSL